MPYKQSELDKKIVGPVIGQNSKECFRPYADKLPVETLGSFSSLAELHWMDFSRVATLAVSKPLKVLQKDIEARGITASLQKISDALARIGIR